MSKQSKNYSRREFTQLSALGMASVPLMSFQSGLTNSLSKSPEKLSVHLFSKHLQFLDYNDMSAAAATMGFDGLDLTVRPKGHVLPENVVTDLPKAVAAMQKHALAVKMMTTNVWDANNSVQKKVLETASSLGITHYRTDWLKYPEDTPIQESQALYGLQAKELEELNKTLGLIGGYQNHAGKHVGAPVWDLLPIFEATQGKHIGCQYDIRHAVVEGGESWELGLERILPYINSIVIKDFKWGIVDGKWKIINVPLGEGMVNFSRYFSLLKKYQINVPVSLHVEHELGGAEKGRSKLTISEQEVISRIQKDLDYLRAMWEKTV